MSVRNRSAVIALALAATVVALLPAPVSAADSLTVALLPLANYTSDPTLLALVAPRIVDSFRPQTDRLVTPNELRPTLRRNRIRAVGGVDSEGARAIARASHVNYLMLGSIDFVTSSQVPEAGLSLRLLNVETMRVVWAGTVAATGEDYVSLLDRGRITDRVELIDRLIAEIRDDFHRATESPAFSTPTYDGPRIALIPFDDHDPGSHSGQIFSAHLLTTMITAGLDLCEPGEVHALLQRHRRVFRGEIDLLRLGVLHDSLGIDVVVTGHIQQFTPGTGTAATPQLELGARMIDASTGHIAAIFQWRRDGAQTETVFGIGITHAIGRLTQAAASDLLKHFDLNDDPPTLGKK